ncbi:UNVERIFIED_CONTAM: hypothetical protein FKN15_023998 [Acipenser sinensis]
MLGELPGRTGLEASCHDIAEGGMDEDRFSESPEAQEEISEPEEEDGEMSYHYSGYHGTSPVSQLFKDLQELATLERYREEEAAIVQGHLSIFEEAGGRDGRHERREEEVEEEQNETKLWKQRLKMASIEEEEEEDEEEGDILVSRLPLEGAEKIYEEIDSGGVFEVIDASAETSIEEPEHGELDEAEKREAPAENWGNRLSSGFQSGEAEKTRLSLCFSALHVAVQKKDVEIVKLLLDAGADITGRDLSCGRSALHLAVEGQSADLTELLLRRGAPPNPVTYAGHTPLYSALYRPSEEVRRLLREHGAQELGSELDWEEEEEEEEEGEEEFDDLVINGHPVL